MCILYKNVGGLVNRSYSKNAAIPTLFFSKNYLFLCIHYTDY